MWWEFGEAVKSALDTIGLTEARVTRWCSRAACWCEQRRTWLNELGEGLWAAINPPGYSRTKNNFAAIVEVSLSAFPLSESSLHSILCQNGVRLSRHTTARWLSQMVASGALSELNAGGERWLSLR